jgi:hypothetical protein
MCRHFPLLANNGNLRDAPPYSPQNTKLANDYVCVVFFLLVEPNCYLYKCPSSLILVIFPAYITYEDGGQIVPKRRYINCRSRGITQKKEYNIPKRVKV